MNIFLAVVALALGAALTACALPSKKSDSPAASSNASAAQAAPSTTPQAAASPAATPAASATSTQPEVDMSKAVTTKSGLKYVDIVEGTGPTPQYGQAVTVNYTGRLADGTKFDSSYDRNQPFTFVIGVGQVIKGWDEGVSTMKVGGKRRLIIPPHLGYGERGFSNVIPPNSELDFDVELLSVR